MSRPGVAALWWPRDPRVHAGDGRSLLWAATAAAAAAGAAVAIVLLHWQGADWPAQLYRVTLAQRTGWVPFDTGWYGGNYPLAYSALFPVLGALAGVGTVVAACAAIATWAFSTLVADRYPTRAAAATACLATGVVVQIAVGQASFLLGFTFALLAVVALGRWKRPWPAAGLGMASALASSLAALFLLVALAAVALTTGGPSRRRVFGVVVATCAPIATVTLLYHPKGRFPYPVTSLACVLAASVAAWWLFPRRERTIRAGITVYALVAVVLFVVPSPVGGIVTRLGSTIALPIAVCVVRRIRRPAVMTLLALLLAWQWAPAVGALTVRHGDRSTAPSYFAPLTAELHRIDAGPTRIEITPTRDHWEAAVVAPHVTLARGWERQLDTVDNPVFYDDEPLVASTYHAWLDDNGVTWVALPDVPLDYSARKEAAILRHGTDFLTPVWHDAHWRLWRVDDSPGLVTGPARLTALSTDTFTLVARHAGVVTVRVRANSTWTITRGRACIDDESHRWLRITTRQPGTIRVAARFVGTRTSC